MPQPRISRRAAKVWDRLRQWYGARLAEQYGDVPPPDWCDVVDRTDDERLDAALSHVRHQTPVHPPTLGQLEDAIPKRDTGNHGPSKPQRLSDLMFREHGAAMCRHQFSRPLSYFGPLTTFELKSDSKKPNYVTHPEPRGAVMSACEECGKPSFRVLLENDLTAAA